jgi:pimeloyl-ACP methyl ester carboxylesterase
MNKRAFLTLVAASTLALTAPIFAQSTQTKENPKTIKSAYADVNGLHLYYEIHGGGKPLVLIHGGLSASEAFGPSLEELAKGRQVIAVHLQGHGRTHDIHRPLRFEIMADDIAALISQLGLGKADVMGYSLGGGVALQIAIRHPEAVDKLVVVSEPMKRDAWYPEVNAAFDRMAANAPMIAKKIKASPMATLYPDVDWETLVRKIGEMESRGYDWSADVAKIKTPTMLVFADADAISPEHIVEFYKLLGGGRRDAGLDGSLRPVNRLAIVPGATHYNIFSTIAVADLVTPFLNAKLPPAR